MKVILNKLFPFLISIGIITAWFAGLQFLVAENSDILIRSIAYIISTALVITILDYTIE